MALCINRTGWINSGRAPVAAGVGGCAAMVAAGRELNYSAAASCAVNAVRKCVEPAARPQCNHRQW